MCYFHFYTILEKKRQRMFGISIRTQHSEYLGGFYGLSHGVICTMKHFFTGSGYMPDILYNVVHALLQIMSVGTVSKDNILLE